MTRDQQRAYVRQWVETGTLLEDLRWRELRGLNEATALAAADALIEAALQAPLPTARVGWSGLVDLQDALHRRRR